MAQIAHKTAANRPQFRSQFALARDRFIDGTRRPLQNLPQGIFTR